MPKIMIYGSELELTQNEFLGTITRSISVVFESTADLFGFLILAQPRKIHKVFQEPLLKDLIFLNSFSDEISQLGWPLDFRDLTTSVYSLIEIGKTIGDFVKDFGEEQKRRTPIQSSMETHLDGHNNTIDQSLLSPLPALYEDDQYQDLLKIAYNSMEGVNSATLLLLDNIITLQPEVFHDDIKKLNVNNRKSIAELREIMSEGLLAYIRKMASQG